MESSSFISATVLLILVTDPLGNIPLFIGLLRQVDPARRRRIIIREVFLAFAILLFFLFFGSKVLEVMHLTETSLGIAGGVILFLIALKMIFPHPEGAFAHQVKGEPFLVPLAIPFIAGPSAIATVLLLVSREPHRMWEWIGALTVAMLVSAVVLGFAEKIANFLGEQVTMAFERLMGLILTAIAIEMLLAGIETFVRQLGTH
ncbi:MarC family protein [Chitinimonas koreensis]|uniref:MarC family protein n=1 Tax=Chitinimonas koreensis TaxID=356302 RepID=UPI0004218911|nr:MarC family protein [Chitinimonas koreensis]QNM97263.1 MarC family protein [Chitinimonas koreensis]